MERKNVFGVLNTADQIDGVDLIIRTNPPEVLDKLDRLTQEVQQTVVIKPPSKRMVLLRVLALAAGAFFIIFGISNAQNAGDLSFAGVFRQSALQMVLGLLLILASVALVFVEHKLRKSMADDVTDSYAELKERSRIAEQEAYTALQVPETAIEMDLLTSVYSKRNGSVKSVSYTAFAFRAWVENGRLCLSDVENVVAVPLDAIQGISEIKQRVPFYFWNKPEPPNSEAYRAYHIRKTYFGAYSVKGVCAVHIRTEYGEYELLVPPYELENFLRLTGKAIRKGPQNQN